MKKIGFCLSFVFLVFLNQLAIASDSVYLNTLSLLDNVMMIFFSVAYVVGAAFTFMGLVYYRRFRQNPNETPLSKVLWTLILGLLLFFFPLMAKQLPIYQTLNAASEQAP